MGEKQIKEAVVTKEMPKKKKSLNFPSAFTVLMLVLLLATILTWVVPAGKFKTLTYNADSTKFELTDQKGEVKELPGEQKTLDNLKISIKLDSFKNKDIKKPIAIPNTYARIESSPQGPIDFVKAPIEGIIDSIDIIVFILILGGVIGIVNESHSFDAGINALAKIIKGKEFLLVVILFLLIALGGTTFGLAEETIAFYPILMPIFIASGYDAIVAIATIYMGSSIGSMFSTTNPFATVIGSNAAGISFKTGMGSRIVALVLASIITLIYIYMYIKKVKKDPTKSLVYEQMDALKAKYLSSGNDEDKKFTVRKKIMLIIFALAFPTMIYGVVAKGWWFTEMTALFFFVGLLLMFISGFSEKKAVSTFFNGAADLVSVAIVVGVARAINIIMDRGNISDTLLNASANSVTGMNGILFAAVLFLLFSVLGLFIPSSSGLATLSMPIVAPLGDTVNVGRDVVVSAYNYGQGWMSFITPTGLILATLEMVDVTYDKWLKFIMPLMGIMAAFSVIMLSVQHMFKF